MMLPVERREGRPAAQADIAVDPLGRRARLERCGRAGDHFERVFGRELEAV